MRVSVLRNDPGFRDDAYKFKVYLDGKELKKCVTADEELGEAVIITGSDIDRDTYSTVYGCVELEKH